MIDVQPSQQTERPATPRMVAFLTRLAQERDISEDARERLTAELNRNDDPNDDHEFPFVKAKRSIDWLIKQPLRSGYVKDRIKAMPRGDTLEHRVVRDERPITDETSARKYIAQVSRERPQNPTSRNMQRDPETLLHSGVFRLDGEIYIIVPTKNNKHIAKRLVETPPRLTSSGETVKFDYVNAPGIIWALYEEHRLPLDDIRAMIVLHRVCIYPGCYRSLKAAKSVAAGVGKRHAAKLGIPWGGKG